MRALVWFIAALLCAAALPASARELPPVLQLERADIVVAKGGDWSLWAELQEPAGWPKLGGFVAPTGRAKAELRAGELQGWSPLRLPLAAGLAVERACSAPLVETADRVEALTAFREKRAPRFEGR